MRIPLINKISTNSSTFQGVNVKDFHEAPLESYTAILAQNSVPNQGLQSEAFVNTGKPIHGALQTHPVFVRFTKGFLLHQTFRTTVQSFY